VAARSTLAPAQRADPTERRAPAEPSTAAVLTASPATHAGSAAGEPAGASPALAPDPDPLDFDDDWPALAAVVTGRLERPGLVGQFMHQSELIAREGATFSLRVPVRPLAEPALIGKVRDVLATHFGRAVRLVVEVGQVRGTTVAAVRTLEQAQAQAQAQATIEGDAFVQTLLTAFDGTILPESVQPLGPNGDTP
jgi:DNA polymerase-3 subunit gamma/tau